jgi:2-polyprenyl-6-methoxyphenol hydroxylase-like FAD-dependent oxidoreductase
MGGGVCFFEHAGRSPTIFWGITEKTKGSSSNPLFQFNQDSKYRNRILDHYKELIGNGPWHKTLKKLVKETRQEDILAPWVFRTTEFPEEPSHFPIVPSGRIILLGDAAHVMPPSYGLVGSHVLEDARLLTELLTSGLYLLNWKDITATYESKMIARVKKVVHESSHIDVVKKRLI